MAGLGIFGGSFDPVHKGHKRLAQFMCRSLSLSKMLIIPTGMSPFKSSSGASSEDRLKMCTLAFPEEEYTVSDIEILRQGKSYTVDTVREIKKRYPHERLYLIIGSDQLLSFDRWYKFREILENATLCAVSREGSVNKELLERFADEHLRMYGECLIFDFEPFEVSSTEIRRMIKEEVPADELIDKEVMNYILSEGLYKNE